MECEVIEKEKKKVTQVVNTSGKTKKKGLVRRFSNLMISEDVGDVKTYLLVDVLIPGVKDIIYDMFTGGIERLLFTDDTRRSSNKRGTNYSRNNYTSKGYHRGGRDDRDRDDERSGVKSNTFEEIYLDSKNDAITLIESMQDLVDEYDAVTILDYSNLVGIDVSYSLDNYGWTDVDYLSPIRKREGYIVGLKRPVRL